MAADVAIASCKVLPEPDPDAELLSRELSAAGIAAEVLAWDDPGADFSSARLTLLRSTWNYPNAPRAFASWVEAVAATSSLWNPIATVRWNLHKSYLLDLGRAGVRTVPTRLVRCGEPTALQEISRELGAKDLVVKPAVSAASRATVRVTGDDRERGEAHLRALAANEDVLVQPYLSSVEGYGERAVVWIDGEVTHAVRKSPRFMGDAEVVSEAVPVAADEADLARRAAAAAVARVGAPLLYARIDVARDSAGAPVLMELELIEPSLFFRESPAALARFVRAVRRLLDGARQS